MAGVLSVSPALLERYMSAARKVSRLAVGDPAKAIASFANEVGADLVVVGHVKRGLIERWWSGPTGAYICDYVNCSLLIARNAVSDEEFEAQMMRSPLGASAP